MLNDVTFEIDDYDGKEGTCILDKGSKCGGHFPHICNGLGNKRTCRIKRIIVVCIPTNKEYCNCYACIEKRLLGET